MYDVPRRQEALSEMLDAELAALTPYNCARYRITLGEVQA